MFPMGKCTPLNITSTLSGLYLEKNTHEVLSSVILSLNDTFMQI